MGSRITSLSFGQPNCFHNVRIPRRRLSVLTDFNVGLAPFLLSLSQLLLGLTHFLHTLKEAVIEFNLKVAQTALITKESSFNHNNTSSTPENLTKAHPNPTSHFKTQHAFHISDSDILGFLPKLTSTFLNP